MKDIAYSSICVIYNVNNYIVRPRPTVLSQTRDNSYVYCLYYSLYSSDVYTIYSKLDSNLAYIQIRLTASGEYRGLLGAESLPPPEMNYWNKKSQ